jgi:hypothetical protein
MHTHPGVFNNKPKDKMAKRRRIKISRVLIALSGLCLLVALVMGIMLLFSARPPVYAVTICQNEISKAREAEADKYAAHILVTAETTCQLATNEWKYQNDRIFSSEITKCVLGPGGYR